MSHTRCSHCLLGPPVSAWGVNFTDTRGVSLQRENAAVGLVNRKAQDSVCEAAYQPAPLREETAPRLRAPATTLPALLRMPVQLAPSRGCCRLGAPRAWMSPRQPHSPVCRVGSSCPGLAVQETNPGFLTLW